MSVNTLSEVSEIGGFGVIHQDEKFRPLPIDTNGYIWVDHFDNTITFKLQSAPYEEVMMARMLPRFGQYMLDITKGDAKDWDTEEFAKHTLKCIEENSQDWKDFLAKYGDDYTGVDGCQVDTIIQAAYKILEGLNKEVPCNENMVAMMALQTAEGALIARKANRKYRGVEGTPQA